MPTLTKWRWKKQVQRLQRENQTQKTELGSYKSVKNQLNFAAAEAELSNTKKLLNKVLDFGEKLGLKAQLEKFLNQKIDKAKQEKSYFMMKRKVILHS